VRGIAALFAATAFEEPRKIDPATLTPNMQAYGLSGRFKLVGGTATYQIRGESSGL
jgi:hypothetical protein